MSTSTRSLDGTYPAIERMQHRVSRPVCNAASTMSLPTLTEVQTLTTECTLVDLAVVHSTEWHANVLQLMSHSQPT